MRVFLVAVAALLCAGANPRTDSRAGAPAANAGRVGQAVQAVQTGRLQLVFEERSPLSFPEPLLERLEHDSFIDLAHMTPKEAALEEYDITRESFDVQVPASYRADVPHGLFVWVGVTEYSPEWIEVLARHRIIFITANNTGGRALAVKEGLALDAVHNMRKRFNIDPQRIFVSGFSAGGQVATWMLRRYPEVFSGGLLLMGGYFYASYEVEKKGRREPTVIPGEPGWFGGVEKLKKSVKIVMLKGEDDPTGWTEFEGQADLESLTLDGFTRVSLFVLPKWGHMHPKNDYFEKGIEALDAPAKTPPTTGPTKERRMQPGQVAQAKRLFMSAEYLLNPYTPPGRPKLKPSKQDQDRARVFLQQAVDDFPAAPTAASAQQMLDKLGRSTTQPHATGRLRLTFEDRNPLGKEITKRRPFADVDATTQPYDLKKESFEVFVPPTYRANVAHGLLVWIDTKSAELPESWKEALGRHKLIWVSANDTGRSRAILPRVGLALDAVENLKKLYTLSEDRVYVSGFGDGADVAWKVVEGFPDQFNGAVLMMGSASGAEWEGDAEKLKKELRLVIMSGEGRGAQRAAFDALVKDGFERVRFIEVQRAGKTVPEGKWLEKGLIALEAKKGV